MIKMYKQKVDPNYQVPITCSCSRIHAAFFWVRRLNKIHSPSKNMNKNHRHFKLYTQLNENHIKLFNRTIKNSKIQY